jgi:hypothetical protein
VPLLCLGDLNISRSRQLAHRANYGEDQHMSRSEVYQPAGREPTKEERAAAAAVLQMIWGIHGQPEVPRLRELC